MIPIVRRSTRRLETTLVSCSRQSLPRPARLYSTPSKKSNAPGPALGTASAAHTEFPTFMGMQSQPSSSTGTSSHSLQDMQGFLDRTPSYTMLPTPLPEDKSSLTNSMYFPDSPTQDLIAIIDACMHNCYDVPRAKMVFERLRSERRGDPILSAKLYNSVLDSYIRMAKEKDIGRRTHWIEDACALYEAMESGREKVLPTANTYAQMLLVWLRYNQEAEDPISRTVDLISPTTILQAIADRNIPATMVITDKAFTSDADAAAAIKLLSKAAVEMNLSKVIVELGAVEVLGSQVPDPLDDVPEAMPVKKAKKPVMQVTHNAEGEIVDLSVVSQPEEVEYEVPFNLTNLRKHLSQVTLARRILPEDVTARQKLLEESVYDVAVERWKRDAQIFEELGLGRNGLDNVDIRNWMWNWHVKLQARLKAEIANLIKEEAKLTAPTKINARLGPFLSLVKPEKLSLLTILEIMHLQGKGGVTDGMKTARALIAVGKSVEIEHKAEMCKKNNIHIPASGRPQDQSFFSNLGYRALHERRVAAAKYMEDSEEWAAEWTQIVRVRVGSFLVDALMDVANVTRTALDKTTGETVHEEHPAFFHAYEYLRGHKLGVIKLNPVVSDRMAKDQLRETLHPRHLPMLVKPKPWLAPDQGGYLYNKTPVMRYKDSQEQQSYVREASTLGNLELVYASLDVLGSTPWQINRAIFNVVLKVWNSGERLGKIPPAVYDQPEPEKPENYDTDPKARVAYLMRHKSYAQNKSNNHSERCSTNYKIEIARAFIGDTLYLPHNVDFRGRAYPIPPNLNHIGDDLSRGLLKFAEAKPLGERGLRWLKIHLANLYGYDKASFDERVTWVHDHLKQIYDSAEHPLDGECWWKKADDPWQCLAACIEIRNALESGDPLAYECSLPVHQDGTCNGLQHYAALGGDARGAQQVNLGITDRPSDVYTHVADMVEEMLRKDALEGNKYGLMLSGKIQRKVVKQTVMTTVYGVTFIGAREQIEKQLKDRVDMPAEETWIAAAYLAKAVLSCIGDLFSGAKHIQNWLNMSAKLIAKSIPPDRLDEAVKIEQPVKRGRATLGVAQNRMKKEQMTSVIWTTPLGLPIVQPYRQTRRKQIMTSLQTVFISDPNMPATVNGQKQASAFPPNFIHSLDATHMMLTALECRNRDITFASVHDSYWTHASSVDEMSTIIRDTFIALHSSDVLTKLHQEFTERYKGYKIPVNSLRSPGFVKKLAVLFGDESAASESGSLLEDGAEEDEEEALPVVAAKSRGRKAVPLPKVLQDVLGVTEDEMPNRFVDVTDLLPPLPQKGTFDVSTIKGSLYFFS